MLNSSSSSMGRVSMHVGPRSGRSIGNAHIWASSFMIGMFESDDGATLEGCISYCSCTPISLPTPSATRCHDLVRIYMEWFYVYE